MMQNSRKPQTEKGDAAALGPDDVPMTPVRDFDPEKADGNRRMFQNGDTDRSSDEASDKASDKAPGRS